jgi:hypothetical protein
MKRRIGKRGEKKRKREKNGKKEIKESSQDEQSTNKPAHSRWGSLIASLADNHCRKVNTSIAKQDRVRGSRVQAQQQQQQQQ